MIVCGCIRPPTINLVAESISKGIGRKVVETRIRMYGSTVPDPIKWCSDCGRYYNSNSPHECNMRAIKENRESLERFLKHYKVIEDLEE
jgi:hypothetical protein